MNPRRRVLFLIAIIAVTVLVVETATIGILYHAAFEEERARLVETARSQARMIEAVARFNAANNRDFPGGPREATMRQVRDAHANYRGFGETGEFTLSMRDGDQMIFLLDHRHGDLRHPQPVPWKSNLAEPMRLALSGRSGTIVGRDYRGQTVLAAFEPVAELNLGIVAKIDLPEIQAPFIRAGLIGLAVAGAMIALGAGTFVKIVHPIIQGLHDTVAKLEKALGEVKTLKGILPICSFCKKVRNDQGYWDQVEVYVHQHTEADFSHSICPDCMAKHYPDYTKGKWHPV